MRRTGQGGSILGFIIAAVVLTAFLVGGVYLVHTQPQPTPAPTQLPSANSESHQLPQTGPEQTLVTMIVLAVFSGTFVSYVRSRRTLASL